jgi:hypothetical protein
MIKSIPSVSDETIVLPCSAIGKVAAFARRNGTAWFLAVLNGPEKRKVEIPLGFLKEGKRGRQTRCLSYLQGNTRPVLSVTTADDAAAVEISSTRFRPTDVLSRNWRQAAATSRAFQIAEAGSLSRDERFIHLASIVSLDFVLLGLHHWVGL